VPEILADGACGVLFKPEDPEALSSGIEDLLRKPGKRREIAVAALERARLLFRSGRVAREVEAQWNKLFDETIYKNRAWRWIEEDFSRGKMPRTQNATT
jgi:glycosyltransferase involved in cell wall biosynthesis